MGRLRPGPLHPVLALKPRGAAGGASTVRTSPSHSIACCYDPLTVLRSPHKSPHLITMHMIRHIRRPRPHRAVTTKDLDPHRPRSTSNMMERLHTPYSATSMPISCEWRHVWQASPHAPMVALARIHARLAANEALVPRMAPAAPATATRPKLPPGSSRRGGAGDASTMSSALTGCGNGAGTAAGSGAAATALSIELSMGPPTG